MSTRIPISMSRKQIVIKFILNPGKLHISREDGSILPGFSINRITSALTRHQSLWGFQILWWAWRKQKLTFFICKLSILVLSVSLLLNILFIQLLWVWLLRRQHIHTTPPSISQLFIQSWHGGPKRCASLPVTHSMTSHISGKWLSKFKMFYTFN